MVYIILYIYKYGHTHARFEISRVYIYCIIRIVIVRWWELRKRCSRDVRLLKKKKK